MIIRTTGNSHLDNIRWDFKHFAVIMSGDGKFSNFHLFMDITDNIGIIMTDVIISNIIRR